MTGAQVLATRVLDAGDAATDPETADVVRRRVFDALGALAAGRTVMSSRRLGALGAASTAEHVRDLCAIARCSEVDDIDLRSCTTPGAIAVPVAIVVAAAAGADGDALLRAVSAGYEAMVAVGEAVDGPLRLGEGVWPTYLAAPLAAAAATGRLLDLDREQTAHALAIAASRCLGTAGRIPGEPTSRWLTCGCAAADGVLAAAAAHAGLVGDLAILDRPLPAGGTRAIDPRRLAASGQPAVARAEVKPFVGARQTLAAVEAAVSAREALGAEPVAVEVAVPEAYREMVDQREPDQRLASLVSAPFQVAAALTEPAALYDVARERPVLAARGRALMAAVEVVADPELAHAYPEVWPARVRLRAADGAAGEATVMAPAWSRRAPDWDDLVTKHVRLGAWDPGLAVRVRAACTDELAPHDLLDLAQDSRPQEVGR